MKPDYRALCEELLKHLEWYIEEDDTNDGEENEYWLKGKRDAMEVVSKTKKVFLENPQEEKDSQYESEWFGSGWDEWYKEHTPYKQYLEGELLGKTQ